VVLLGTPAQLRSATNNTTVDVAGSTLPVASKLKSFGVTTDSNLRFDSHARNVAKACNFHTHALRHVRSLLTDDVAQTVACSIVTSRLDYCNALLSGKVVKTHALPRALSSSDAPMLVVPHINTELACRAFSAAAQCSIHLELYLLTFDCAKTFSLSNAS